MADKEPCDDHDEWHSRCDYCRGMFGGTKAANGDEGDMDVKLVIDGEEIDVKAIEMEVATPTIATPQCEGKWFAERYQDDDTSDE